MELPFEWEGNNEEHLSFDDSDRFEEDSLCSWVSEPESICGNWRGWKRNSNGVKSDWDLGEEKVETLIEICSRAVAKHLPFETVERTCPEIPEQLQLRIAFWSFPPFEEDIRLYSCLANGSPDKFLEGEQLLKVQAVKDALQIGFHLSATVHQPHGICQSKGTFNVAVTFDRGHITSCNCTCDQTVTWCSHVIALCLFRIHFPHMVCLRAPLSEYLSRLRRDQLQKFAQYLISELPQQLLPTAQRLLDELLSSQESTINSVSGAPDPTAGPSAADHSKWCLDESLLHENIKKMLVRFCGPSPLVFSDVNALYLANTAPPTAAEWSNLLRPLRGREPEGMWNLLSIVRELFRRGDMNAVNLLTIITEECLANDQVLIWWFDSRSQVASNSSSHSHGNSYRGNTNAASTEATKHACAGFCDELVTLWRLAALNPKLTDEEREEIKSQLQEWHQKAVDKGRTGRGTSHVIPSTAMSCFPGFCPAIEACSLDWKNLQPGIVSEDNVSSLDSPESSKGAKTVLVENRMGPLESVRGSQGVNGENTSNTLESSPIPVQDVDEDLEVLCARTEALHVHGYHTLAGKLAMKLAGNILSDESNLNIPLHPGGARNSNRGPDSSTILIKAAFLCNVLAEDLQCHHLAFRVGMLGLEMPRQPARSKALEVKLANQESDLVSLLKRLPLGPAEVAVVREKAELLHRGQLTRGEAVLPIMLATFIFDVLCLSNGGTQAKRQVTGKHCTSTKEDEELGFQAALHAIGMKGNVLENQYPMLCEGTRRQRGDLALALLLHCREDTSRIRQVMDVLLDKTRYDLPNVTGVTQGKKKVERSDSQDNKSEESEASSNGGSVKTRTSLGLPSRRASNGQNSSSTSDSGTDSSSKDSSGVDRCKARGGNARPTAQRLGAGVVSIDDESGSSSGVDTDSLPIPVRVVDGHQTDLVTSMRTAVPYVDALHLNDPAENENAVSDSRQDLPYLNVPNDLFMYLPKQDASNASDAEPVQGDIGVRDSTRDNQSTVLDKEPHITTSGTVESVHAGDPLENVSQCCGSAGDGPLVYGDDPPLVPAEGVHPNLQPPASAGLKANTQNLKETADYSNTMASNALPSTSESISGERSALITGKTPTSQDLSSEGDVSDIEADFEDSQHEMATSLGATNTFVNTGEKNGVHIPPSVAAVGEGISGSPNVVVQRSSLASICPGRNDQHHHEGEAADVASVPLEAIEELSSESGARGSTSASAEDTDRSRRRSRTRGRRRRRGGKSALYQATEAEAHFMFELAKTVLSKAGGSNSTSVFTQTTSNDTQAGPHRLLQLCAFEIGLFALGLHNRTSSNWLSRTYSSHVSWISGQAMEIGHQAIALLLEHWEGNLTPSEVASIADRASRSNDRAMVRAAAELGLSCLHMATTLNPGEIQRVLSQCREEDPQLLDQACQAVESAARGGGVYPEVLFDVAKHWFHLHERNQTNSGTAARPAKSESRNRSLLSRSSQPSASSSQSPPLSPFLPQMPQFTIPCSYSSMPPPLYTTPEQYVQQQMHQQVHQMMGHYPAYLSGVSSSYRSGSQSHYSYPFSRSLPGAQFSLSGAYAGLTPPPYQTTSASSNCNHHLNRITPSQQGTQVSYYLNSAYRVGMLALEFLARRTSDDRPSVKFSRNPSCSEDIRWLCSLSAKLGTSHLQRFCVAALNAVVSPFVLHDLALEAARYMARSNPAQLAANLRSPTISPLVQKSLTMYAQCIHYNVVNISQSEYDEFVELLRHARGAFCMAPGGMTQFNELLQSIRWGHSKKKELWQMIMSGLAKA